MKKLSTFGDDPVVVTIGASGGIGAALVSATGGTGLTREDLDLTDEASIRAAAKRVKSDHGAVDVVIVATGLLHGGDIAPEKTWARLDPAAMAQVFAVNSIGPALVAKHFLPLLAKGRKTVFAALSARVGSIGDNHIGGWHSYRAAKAALNQLIHGAAIELARTHKQTICVCLHPGTVQTAFTQKYAAHHDTVPASVAAQNLIDVMNSLSTEHSGGFFDYSGAQIPW